MKPSAIIFDIDGTLSDCQHRLPLLPDYQAFHDKLVDDKPIGGVLQLNRILGYASGVHIILCTGRPDSHEQETRNWLMWNGVEYNDLYMRRASDNRKDHVVKEEMLREIEKEFDVILAIDDRPGVVDMWRRNGVVCLQNEYRDHKPKYPSGALVMLIGPSGAGKSTVAKACASHLSLSPHSEVLSSDDMRYKLTGDFKDQSQNERVFSLLHAKLKASLHHGMDCVFDATHIKRKSRLETLACAPVDAQVIYVVLNRPMKEKIKSGGWRNEVMVRDKTLMEYHEEVFNANLKDILSGDGDPRVRVIDWRQYKHEERNRDN